MAGSSTIGALRVVLGLDSAAFTDGLTAAQKHLAGVGKSMQRVGATMATVGAGMTAAITATLIAAGFAASKAATESRDAMGQVEAALKSMGNVAGQTKESLADMATDIMRNSLYDDDDVLRKVTANLLTFGKVAGDEFRRAQVAAVDLATRMGMDLQSATVLVGKALNDPIKGMGALRKAGVQLDEGQQKLVKSLVASGDAAGAQRILLGELEKQFGGSARAAQDTDPYDSLRDSLNDLSEAMGGIVNQYLLPIIDKLAQMAAGFNGLTPKVQTFIVVGAAIAAALGPALIVIGSVVGAIGTLTAAFAGGGLLAGLGAFVVAAAPFIAAAAAIAAAIYLFRDDLMPIFEAFKKAVMDAVGPYLPGILAGAKEAFAALGPAISAVVGVVGPILAALTKAFIAAFGPILITMLKVMAAQVTGVLQVVSNVLRFVAAVLTGDWKGAWNAAGSVVMSVVQTIGRIVEAVFPGIIGIVGRMVTGVSGWLTGKLFDVLNGVISKVKVVGDAFFKLYDAVVGHSYVPDMVEGVAEWMAKLDAGMVVPAVKATDAAKKAFESLRDDVASIMDSLLTDTERAARELAEKTKTIQAAVAAGMITPEQGALAQGGAAWAGATKPSIPTLGSLGTEAIDISKSISDGLAKSKAAFDRTAKDFGDAFAYNMEGVLRGDIKGVFLDMLSSVMRSSMASLGSSLFKSASGGGFGSFLQSLAGSFGGSKLPGFKTGGSFKVGGSGGLDSQVMSFRATPGEMVDIRKPGQQMEGGPMALHVTPSPYFDVAVQRVAGPIAAEFAGHSFAGARQAVPQDMAKINRYSRGRR